MELKKDFISLEEAFGALSQEMREHSLRVEAYTDLLFLEACAAELYGDNIKTKVRLKPELRELVRQAARCHDVGKVLVPEFYQWSKPSFSPEELALYRKHCADGERLAEELIAAEEGATPTRIHVICEAIESHHERWDGQGYPGRTVSDETPIIGRIVAVANALDHLLMETRTETPVDCALSALMEGAGTEYDPAVVNLLMEAKQKLAKVFSLYANQSRAIPQTSRIIRRKATRPFHLKYRPIVCVKTRETVALEADMTFKRGKDWVDYPGAAAMIGENRAEQELGMSFLLELCDMARRLDTCGIRADYIALNTTPGFLRKRGAAKAIAQLLADAETAPERICFILTAEDWGAPTKSLLENAAKLRELGCRILLDQLSVDQTEPQLLGQLHITHCRIGAAQAEALESAAAAAKLQGLARQGISLLADGIEKRRYTELFGRLGIEAVTGVTAGEYISEDQLVLGELALLGK